MLVGRRALIRALLVTLMLSLAPAGCAKPVEVQAGPSATAVQCADVLVNLPDQVGALTRQEVTSQATAAWSTTDRKVTIRLICGIDPPAPTTDPCTTVAGVDWVSRENAGKATIFRSFGRAPAVQVEVPATARDGVDLLLTSVSESLAPSKPTRHCL